MTLFSNLFKPKKTHTEKVMALRTDMISLADDLNVQIMKNLKQVESGKGRNQAVIRVKNAYYARVVLDRAMDDLEETENDADLTKLINRTERTIAKLNFTSEFAPQIKGRVMKWHAEVLGERIAKRDNGEPIPQPENKELSLPEDILERLLSGKTIGECLSDDKDFLTEEYNPGLNGRTADRLVDINSAYEDILKDLKTTL